MRSDKTQRRLRAMIEIINKVEPRFGSALMAHACIARSRCKAFRLDGDALVRSGPPADELDCIDAVNSGVHT